jgi:hypothetical protein
MSNSVRTITLACLVFFIGCRAESRRSKEKALAKEPPKMLQIQNFTVTDKTLALEYKVTNPFENGIWVCYDIWVHGEQDMQDVAMRIDGETVRVKLCFNLESSGAFEDPQAVAKYVRLLPGESCSGTILEDLPVRDYLRESRAEREGRKERKKIVMRRVVFEVGYIGTFGPKWNKILDSWAEKMKEGLIESKPKVLSGHYFLPVNPLITKETLDGQLREVMYLLDYTSLIQKEESAEVFINDVEIPCSIVVHEEGT